MAFIYTNNTIRQATPQQYVPGEALTNMIRAARGQFPASMKAVAQDANTILKVFDTLYPVYRNMWIYRYLVNPANGWMNVTEALVLKRVKKPSEYHATTTVPMDNIGKANTDFWTKFNAFLTWAAHAQTPLATVFDNYIRYRRRFIIDNDLRRYEDSSNPGDYRTLLDRLSVGVDQLHCDLSKPVTVSLTNDQRWRTLQITWNSIVFTLVHMTTITLPEEERVLLLRRIRTFLDICESYMASYNQPVFPTVNIYQKTSIRNRPLNALETAQYIDNNFRYRILNLVMNFVPANFYSTIRNTHNITTLREDSDAFRIAANEAAFNLLAGSGHMFDVFINNRPYINHLATDVKNEIVYGKQAVNLFAGDIRRVGTIKNTSFDTYFNATISTWFSKLRYGVLSVADSQFPIYDDTSRLKQLYVDLRPSGVGYKADTLDFKAVLAKAASAKPAKGTIVTEASLQKWLDRIFIETIKAIPTNNIKADTEYLLGEPEKVYRSGSLYQNLIHLMDSEAKILELL